MGRAFKMLRFSKQDEMAELKCANDFTPCSLCRLQATVPSKSRNRGITDHFQPDILTGLLLHQAALEHRIGAPPATEETAAHFMVLSVQSNVVLLGREIR